MIDHQLSDGYIFTSGKKFRQQQICWDIANNLHLKIVFRPHDKGQMMHIYSSYQRSDTHIFI